MSVKVNCFLIGVQKAGTSSFYNWLSQHPQINAPAEMKDLHFFLQEKYYSKGISWLESFYQEEQEKPVQLKGAVNYIYFPETAAAEIKTYNGDSKFLLILRDPVKRAFSAYQYFKKLGIEKRTFEQAIEDELGDKFESEEAKNHFTYISHGYYHQQILQWLKHFKRESLCIHLYEDLFKNPQQGLQQTFQFLNVDTNFQPQFETVNKTGVVKFKWLNNFIFTNKKRRSFIKKILPVEKIIPFDKKIQFLNWLRDWNTSKKEAPERLTPEQYNSLSKYYIEEIDKLSSFLNINLAEKWKY